MGPDTAKGSGKAENPGAVLGSLENAKGCHPGGRRESLGERVRIWGEDGFVEEEMVWGREVC